MVIYPFIAIIKTNFFTDDEGAIIVLVSLKRRNILVKHVKLSSEIQVKSSELRFVVTISRRDLLKGASFGLSAGLNMSITRAAGLQARVFDVVIVGGGTAGIPTAIFAALSGANVLVVEKTSNLGGTLLLSTGQIAGSGTIFQQRAGIVDSPDAHYDDIMRINRNTSDQSLTRLTVDNAGATINWLADHGFEILPGHPVTGIGHDHFRIARYLQGVNSGISILQAFLPTFQALASKGKITVITESEVVSLSKVNLERSLASLSRMRRIGWKTSMRLTRFLHQAVAQQMLACSRNFMACRYTLKRPIQLLQDLGSSWDYRPGDIYGAGKNMLPCRDL